MSILRPVDNQGEYKSILTPIPCPGSDILTAPLVSIEFNSSWVPAVFTALKLLTRPETYEGTKSDINRVTQDAHCLFSVSGGTMPIGAIIPTMWAVVPSDWLACDGTTYLRVDYPDLYAIIESQYKVDADHFKVPDLRGRAIIGYGIGSGLTPRVMNDSGGSETHALTTAELAAHTHTENTSNPGNVGSLAAKMNASAGSSVTRNIIAKTSNTDSGVVTDLLTGSTGSGTAHENMMPFNVALFVVKAK